MLSGCAWRRQQAARTRLHVCAAARSARPTTAAVAAAVDRKTLQVFLLYTWNTQTMRTVYCGADVVVVVVVGKACTSNVLNTL